jgi:hypothetical protein
LGEYTEKLIDSYRLLAEKVGKSIAFETGMVAVEFLLPLCIDQEFVAARDAIVARLDDATTVGEAVLQYRERKFS